MNTDKSGDELSTSEELKLWTDSRGAYKCMESDSDDSMRASTKNARTGACGFHIYDFCAPLSRRGAANRQRQRLGPRRTIARQRRLGSTAVLGRLRGLGSRRGRGRGAGRGRGLVRVTGPKPGPGHGRGNERRCVGDMEHEDSSESSDGSHLYIQDCECTQCRAFRCVGVTQTAGTVVSYAMSDDSSFDSDDYTDASTEEP